MLRRKGKSVPDAQGSAAWMVAHTVIEAAISWAEAVVDDDARAVNVAVAGLRKAVGAYLKVRQPAKVVRDGGKNDLADYIRRLSDMPQPSTFKRGKRCPTTVQR